MTNTQFNLDTIAAFPIGSPFSYRADLNKPPWYGWITGLGVNPAGELVFRCRYADHPDYEPLVHPANIHPVNKNWDI